ncbi:CHASE domain-containing protein [Mariprofundus ferrooxydans]|uniref:CHASE domain-containing protein n=1 Tax=Mariprofundus ferrooxydans TaxID=314344 RepID=UPI00037527AB|nr:CHASE domain-containing protein [Mariprofundus ferrooxydans]
MTTAVDRDIPDMKKALLATLLMSLLVAGVIIYSWQLLQAGQQQSLQSKFHVDIAEVKTEIDEHMATYEQVLRGARSLFLASDRVTRREWHTYVTTLELHKHYPGIQGVGYAVNISPANLTENEQQMHSEGFPDYHVWPAGKRERYSAITYLEPFDWRNQRAFGYDMFSEPTRHEAMQRACDTGNPALSGKVLLVQETNEKPQAGSLLYLPLYRKQAPLDTVQQRRQALIGWIYSPYRMENMIRGMLDNRDFKGLRLRIYDVDNAPQKTPDSVHPDIDPAALLYDSAGKSSKPVSDDAILAHYTLRMETGGRIWLLDFDALPAYAEVIGLRSLHKEMSAMLLIGLLLILLTWNLFNTQRKASLLAHDLTTSLRQSEERWSFALEGSGDGVWDWDIETGKAFFSPRFKQLLGLAENELGNDIEEWRQRVHPDDIAEVNDAINRHLHGDTPEYSCEHRLRHNSGDYIWVLGRGKVISRSEDGRPLRLVGTKSDISERRQTEESVHLLSQSVHQSGEAVIMTNAEGVIEYVNPAFTSITGYSATEAIGQTSRLLKSGVQKQKFYANMWATISSGRSWRGRIVDQKKDGTTYPAMLTISPITGESGAITHYVGVQQDLHEYEDMEARFHQAQKMEAIGTLIGGIAHDFNNTLAGITGSIFLARKQVQGNPELLERLETVDKLSFRAAAMIKQLLTFSRRNKAEMAPLAIDSFLKETIKLQRISTREDIELKSVIVDHDLTVSGDINLLQQVLVNLLNNARDAVQDRPDPRIEVKLESYSAAPAFLANHPELIARDYACISISDNGRGISPENIDHIFDPFFTTKGVGKGTGLGLSMAYGAVRQHNGVITVDSQPEQGSSFRIYLPLIEVSTATVDETTVGVSMGLGQTVLLVDDHQELLDTNRELLESLNYLVLTASDGEEAVGIYSARRNEIELVILDVVMPKMGGTEACKAIRKINPQARILFATGYDNAGMQQDETVADIPVINKPFSAAKLSTIIHRLLST